MNSLHDRQTINESTKSSLLGAFYRQDSPTFELGQSIADNCPGEEICVCVPASTYSRNGQFASLTVGTTVESRYQAAEDLYLSNV